MEENGNKARRAKMALGEIKKPRCVLSLNKNGFVKSNRKMMTLLILVSG